ncbi:LysR substrate-binding domain-containing protein [Amycolatopsis australiensis]|uniref:DNA-binding transcriptional regulator, LysR family n=1 Tax=Amycolatopsis australiensis TaxID=546364 RepID=A0A1K1R4S4_9PSEU|nr:LysR substrate-binding domain-containing protein [Amycolatopsis australiensis]SFW66921.1 DNA-binding transcriptional regulator, LysR family [Amycolatopsis australiensis]
MLNRFGTGFLRRVDRVLRELEDARRELADTAGLDHGSVAVAAETLLTLTGVVKKFRVAHPGVDIRLYQSSATEMANQLRAGEVDLCFASQPLPGPDLQTRELLREEVLLAVPVGHRLVDRKRVRLEDLAGEPFVTTRPGYWPHELADRLFAAAGIRPEYACESDEPGTTGDLIGAGLGIGLVPAYSRGATHIPGVWLHVDAPDCHRTLSLVRRQDAYLSVAARRLFRLRGRILRPPVGRARERPPWPAQPIGHGGRQFWRGSSIDEFVYTPSASVSAMIGFCQ